MKIALAQINTSVGGFARNTAKIVERATEAASRGAGLVLFPELCLVGYPPLDLLENRSFLEGAACALDLLLAGSSRLPIDLVVGTILPASPGGSGKPLHNTALHIRRGKVLAVHRKVLLPTYDVFDESRYFEPGPSLTRIGDGAGSFHLSICEDIWNDKTFWKQRHYRQDPVEQALEGPGPSSPAPLPLLNLSASPYSQGKGQLRLEMLRNLARRYRVPVLYVNQVGGNDSLVFDGRSMAIDAGGRLVAAAKGFAEDLLVVDTAAPGPEIPPPALDGDGVLFTALVTGLRDYAAKCGFSSAVLGLSGGIDSSLTAAIAAEALGPSNVLGVLMSSPYTSDASVEDAGTLARNLGIEVKSVPITPILDSYLAHLEAPLEGLPGDATEENIQARIRGNILMAISNRFGHLLLSTGNKSELATGFCTLYGDMSGGLAVISDLLKGEVYRLARHVNRDREVIPARVLTRAPSAELRPGQRDEDSLPPYEVLDPVLRAYVEEHRTPAEIAAGGTPEGLVREILNRVEGNEYKRQQAAPGIKVSWKAFGLGRRYPIAKARLF
jgi:NAD+ synthase (glutamine-hydrolysing)